MATLTLLRFSPPPRFGRSPAPSPPALHLPLRRTPPAAVFSLPARRSVTVSMSRSTVPATDRLISILAYTLPLVNSLHHGRFLFSRVPAVATAFAPVLPLVAAYHSTPFASVVVFFAFFALYLGVARNPVLSRYVRFNATQAILINVLLSLPALVQMIGNPSRGVGLQALEIGYYAVFAFSLGCFVYALIICLLGWMPRLPLLSFAADQHL